MYLSVTHEAVRHFVCVAIMQHGQHQYYVVGLCSSVTKKQFKIAASLLEAGADPWTDCSPGYMTVAQAIVDIIVPGKDALR